MILSKHHHRWPPTLKIRKLIIVEALYKLHLSFIINLMHYLGNQIRTAKLFKTMFTLFCYLGWEWGMSRISAKYLRDLSSSKAPSLTWYHFLCLPLLVPLSQLLSPLNYQPPPDSSDQFLLSWTIYIQTAALCHVETGVRQLHQHYHSPTEPENSSLTTNYSEQNT